MTDNDRPQDVGRRHTRKRPDGPPDVLLERYQRTMRVWLTRLLDELDGAPPKPGLLDDVDAAAVTVYPDPIAASKLWDLAIRLGRELGTAIDPSPPTTAASGSSGPRPRKRVDYG